MREQFEEIKNGCPWIETQNYDTNELFERPRCAALFSNNFDSECHYKNCAVLFWLRNVKLFEPTKNK